MKKYNIKKSRKKSKKIFTKEKLNNKIKRNYNFLEVNFKIYRKKSRLHLEKVILQEIRRELNGKRKVISYIFPKTFVKIYIKGIERGFNSKL